MSQDIRSFFGAKPKGKPTLSKDSSSSSKRKAIIIDSDEEEKSAPKKPGPEKSSSSHSAHNKKRRVIDDSDEEKTPAKKPSSSSSTPNLSKLRPVNVADVFSSAPIKRLDTPRPTKKAIQEEIDTHSDEEFEKTLLSLDESEVVPDTPVPKKHKSKEESPEKRNHEDSQKKQKDKKEKESPKSGEKSSPSKSKDKHSSKHKESSSRVHEKHSPEKKHKESPKKKDKEVSSSEKHKEDKVSNGKGHEHSQKEQSGKVNGQEHKEPEAPKKLTPEKKKPEKVASSSEEGTPKRTKKDLNDSVLTDEERFERKRMSAMLYQKFKNRSGPANPGSKEIPKGKPNCLAGLQFVVTGVLESMERDECAQVIKDFGGKVVASVSKKLTHMVVGEDAGPSKLAKAEELGIPQISEDQLLDLIRERSGLPVKGADKASTSEQHVVKRIKEEKSPTKPTKEKKRKSDSSTPKKKTPEKRSEFSSPTTSRLPKIPKLEKQSPAEKKTTQIEKVSPKKKLTQDHPPVAIKHEETAYEKDIHSADNMAWVDKYKPTSVKQIIGQTGPASNVQKLLNWLQKWYSNRDPNKKIPRPSPWAKNDDGAYFKAALLSGPPGVGKTTTATLVCQELGFDAVEFNASDTRSKKLLKEEVSELLTNKSLFGYFTGGGRGEKVSSKHVLLMDEVDGMAGNEDRGGMQELIALIKDSHVPVICMCNDRNHPKIRSLVNYCFDLKFNKPRVEQIKGAMMSVCFKEGLKLAPGALEEIIAGTGNDVRQTLNHLALYNAGKALNINLSADKAKQEAQAAKKDVKLGPWEVIRKVFSAEEHKTMSIYDKSDLFFHDYSIGPLFVQENYLKVTPKVPKAQLMDRVALTADSLSRGDMVDRRIRSNMAWSLLPLQAMYSSVLPGEYMEGNFTGQINFPGWLGKNSKASKRKRLAQEVHDHTRISTSGSRLSVRLDYAPFLLSAIVRPLKEKGSDGVGEALSIIKEYRLLREDLEALVELTSWPKKKSPMDEVDGKVKAALTRAYNKEIAPYSYSVVSAVKKKKAEAVDETAELYGEEDGGVYQDSDDEKEDDNLDNNAFIKVKKKPAGKDTSSTVASSKAGGSKAKPGTASKGKKK